MLSCARMICNDTRLTEPQWLHDDGDDDYDNDGGVVCLVVPSHPPLPPACLLSELLEFRRDYYDDDAIWRAPTRKIPIVV